MGVMACSRKNCESVMCDTYIPEIGYICNSCQTEFRSLLEVQKVDVKSKTRSEIVEMLVAFMYSTKDDKDRFDTIDEFFNFYS